MKDAALDPSMKIKHNYERKTFDIAQAKKESKLEASKSQKCPKCGQFIKIIELEAHMKICMMNT